MLGRVVTAAIIGLTGGVAYAQGPKGQIQDCEQQLIATQALVQSKVEADALTEGEQEAVYAVLDRADALCTDGDSGKARKTLARVNKMIGKMIGEGQ